VDKDLLRIVIISVGAIVILGMVLWGMFKSSKRKNMFYDHKSNPLENVDPNLYVNTSDDDFDIVPLSTQDNDDYQPAPVSTRLNSEYIQESKAQANSESDLGILAEESGYTAKSIPVPELKEKQLPALLQLHLVARDPRGFTGLQLVQAFERVSLVFGSVQVFERLDAQNRVDYAVASMAEPGVFPGNNWESYTCPGVSFFMQPREVDDVNAVFNDLIETIGQLSGILKGDVLDENKQLLTELSLQEIKERLA